MIDAIHRSIGTHSSVDVDAGQPLSRPDDGYGPVPKRSPFKAGDRVQLHAYPHDPGYWEQRGFRGVVLGGAGGELCGLTDDGQKWTMGWVLLVRDGQPNPAACSCACCPRPVRRPKRAPAAPRTVGPVPACLLPYLPQPAAVQLDLFGVAT